MNISPTVVILLLMLAQVSVPPAIRIGDVARQLSEQDVAEIERIVSSGSRKPWLLNGPRGQIADLRSIEVYFPPEKITPELRRGSVVDVLTGSASALLMLGIRTPSGASPGWTAMKSEVYGQVAITGRPYNQVEGDQDLNRPFRIVGQFDDAELVELVRFVRLSPAGPAPTAGAPRASVHGDWPVIAVVRQTDSVQVRIRKDDSSSELVTLRRQASGWLVIAITLVFR